MKQVVALAKGKHGAEHCVAHAEAAALARTGLLQAARLSSSRACTWPCKKGDARRQQVTGRRSPAIWKSDSRKMLLSNSPMRRIQ
jgi:hypothetical protein